MKFIVSKAKLFILWEKTASRNLYQALLVRRCTIGLPGKFAQRTPSGISWDDQLTSSRFVYVKHTSRSYLDLLLRSILRWFFLVTMVKLPLNHFLGNICFPFVQWFEAYLSLRWEYNKPLRDFSNKQTFGMSLECFTFRSIAEYSSRWSNPFRHPKMSKLPVELCDQFPTKNSFCWDQHPARCGKFM